MEEFRDWCPKCGKWTQVCEHGEKIGMKDLLGNELKVGSVILYPNRRGSSLWMSVAIVLRADPATAFEREHLHVYAHSHWETEKMVPSTIHCIDRVVRVHPDEYNDKIKWMVKEFWTNRYKPEGETCNTSDG